MIVTEGWLFCLDDEGEHRIEIGNGQAEKMYVDAGTQVVVWWGEESFAVIPWHQVTRIDVKAAMGTAVFA